MTEKHGNEVFEDNNWGKYCWSLSTTPCWLVYTHPSRTPSFLDMLAYISNYINRFGGIRKQRSFHPRQPSSAPCPKQKRELQPYYPLLHYTDCIVAYSLVYLVFGTSIGFDSIFKCRSRSSATKPSNQQFRKHQDMRRGPFCRYTS
jgi:hypothetical protein